MACRLCNTDSAEAPRAAMTGQTGSPVPLVAVAAPRGRSTLNMRLLAHGLPHTSLTSAQHMRTNPRQHPMCDYSQARTTI